MTLKYFNVKNGLTTGNITLNAGNSNITASTFVGNINVTGSANLGSNGNVKITGGTSGYVLSTDGAGNLSWVAQSGGGGGTPGGSNTQVQYNKDGSFAGSSGFTFDDSNLKLTVSNLTVSNTFVLNTGTTLGVLYRNALGEVVTGSNLTFNGGSLFVNGGVTADDFYGNLRNGSSNIRIIANGNINLSSAGSANVVVVTSTGANINGTLNATGNANVGNIGATNGVFTNVSGNGSQLSSITGANVTGQVGNSLIAGTVYTNAQPNITSVGTLTDANVSGNVVIGGNLTVSGTTTYINVTNLAVSDPVIQLQTGANGASPVSNSGKDVGTALNYYDTAARVGFMGWDVSNAEIALASNVTLTNEVATFNQYANVRAGYFIGNGSQLTGITSAAYANYISNGTSNVNILTANGNVTVSVNGNANIVTVTGTGANVSGTLNATGNLTVANANLGNLATANFFSGNGSLLTSLTGGNVTGQVANALVAGTVYTNAQPNITSVGLLTALSVGPNSSITLTGTSGYVKANSLQGTDGVNSIYLGYNGVTGAVGVTSNLTVGVGSAGNITANGNVTANYFIGNGSSLSSITGGNVTGQVANALIAGTVYTNAQPNITSLGTLTGLTSNGTINFTSAGNVSLGAVGNIKITGGTSGYVLQTDGAGNLSWVAQSGGGGGGASISNGTSNVNIATADGNITMGVGGNANIVVVTDTGANVNGTLTVSGITNLGSVSNVKISGGSANYVLKTDGAGNLSWTAQSGGGGGGNGAVITDDNTTNATYYPVYATADSGDLTIAGIATAKMQFVPSSGQLTVQDLNTLSDATLKENAEPITDPFSILSRIFGMGFNWKDTGKKSYGVLAQMLEQVLPELVSTNAQGVKTVNYIPIIAFLVEAVKQQQADIEQLKQK